MNNENYDHYSVTVCITVSVLAQWKEEAEEVALDMVNSGAIARLKIDADSACATAIKTRDQTMLVKRLAVNY